MITVDYDIHSLVTRHLFPEETKGMTLEQIKTNLPELRKKVKAGVFAYFTGGDASYLLKANVTKEEAEDIFERCSSFLK